MYPIHGIEIAAPCGHHYDKGCMLELFSAATRDESLYPPRCCQRHIPPSSIFPYMTPQARRLFEEKANEFKTLRRVYCANPVCSRFLGAQSEGGISMFRTTTLLTCTAPECRTVTCGRCKSRVEHDAPHRCSGMSAGDQSVLALGERQGWARCPGCGQLIEHNAGCFHLICLCKTEFCYLCKARWKTCTCPQWDAGRLHAAAEQRADEQLRLMCVRRQGAVAPGAASAAARVALPRVTPVARPEPRARPALAAVPAQAPRAINIHTAPRAKRAPVFPEERPSTHTASSSATRGAQLTERQRLVQHWKDRLRDHHDCPGHKWEYRRGGGVCQNCHDTLRIFLFVSSLSCTRYFTC